MAIETIPIQGVWRLLRWLPGFFLRRFFTQERLAQLIYVDIRPRHDSVVVDLGPTASFSLYLQAINLSPFSVELDRASFRFWLGGVTLNALILKKQIISPGQIATLYIGETIPDGPANQTARYIDNPVTLDGNIEFNCSVRPFAKTVGHLDGINPKFHNANARKDA
jgi:hypothetical protein